MMKTIVSILFLSFTFFVACGQGIKGNGKVVKETRSVSSDFKSVGVSGSFDVYIKEGANSGEVIVEADENLQEHIKVKVKGDRLSIGFENNKYVKNSKKLNIYITARNLEKLALSGSGSIEQNGTNTVNEFAVAISGSGHVYTAADAKEVKLALSGSGDIKIEGQTNHVKMGVSGSGDIEARNLKAKTAKVGLSGSSDVNVYASESIKAATSGSGDITVYGNPSNIDSATSGSGDVTRA